jgi:phosphatidate cytidylyltransferase
MRLELRQRLTYGTIIGLAVLAVLLWDVATDLHIGILLVSLVFAGFGAREFRRLAAAKAQHPRLLPLMAGVVLLAAEAHLHDGWWCPAAWDAQRAYLTTLPLAMLILAMVLLWTAVSQMWRWGTTDFLTSIGATLFGLIYLGVTLNLLNRLALVDGLWAGAPINLGGMLVVLLIVAVKFGDIAAYFGGRAFGRRKMSPDISPGKTWEGFLASFVGAVGGTCLFAWAFGLATGTPPFTHAWQPVVWGLVLGPLGVAGDLAESAMKRDAAVKDSGTSLPGFGGWLDVLDALILAAPAAWLLAVVL